MMVMVGGMQLMAADEELLRDSFTCNIPQDIMVTLQAQSFITEYLNKQYHVALEADILNTLQEFLVATPLERQFMDAKKAINVHT